MFKLPLNSTTRPRAVLYAAEAVFRSWNNERAVKYRQINKVTGLRGTAVNIQAMVYGNMGAGRGAIYSHHTCLIE